MSVTSQKPYVVITEQPQSKALRFRYECEGRSAGSIPGVNSTADVKTFPSIAVHGYRGRAVVVVSCVTKDMPYRPHPHSLVGKEGYKKGVCTVEINSNTMSYVFSNLGIQCVKKKEIEDALRCREEIRVDPFKTGFGHAKQLAAIDMNAVRLCFQVFLEGQQRGQFTEALQPVVSDIIYDKKAIPDLIICSISAVMAPVTGGKKIILLCEKVAKENISIRFFHSDNGRIVWENIADIQQIKVHKQVAITFSSPRYTIDTAQPVMVNIELRRPSDGITSESVPFELLPVHSTPIGLKRKRYLQCGSEYFAPGSTGNTLNNFGDNTGFPSVECLPGPSHAGNRDQPIFYSQYNPTPLAPSGQPIYNLQQQQVYQLPQQTQNQFNSNAVNNIAFNDDNSQNSCLPLTISQQTFNGGSDTTQPVYQQHCNDSEYNLGNLLRMEHGKEFDLNPSGMMNNYSNQQHYPNK
ncbi:embryonic polarity protein dorsal-like [Toxorhynchites rutilus septentrionalis]|uniref:embryonic polarity protein dorsal-like n=1 Tax=Toxorhynchites rutilus septentrionalis TaxID=329112 RepID=UPI00247B18D8|nr:embryonic polarity protein dorsal-like [Toxorhynchites rutilus septentrionalis]